jgi:hypothetical protein
MKMRTMMRMMRMVVEQRLPWGRKKLLMMMTLTIMMVVGMMMVMGMMMMKIRMLMTMMRASPENVWHFHGLHHHGHHYYQHQQPD